MIIFTCSICPSVHVKKKSTIISHIESDKHKNKIKNRKNHKKNNNNDNENNSIFICNICNITYQTELRYNKHFDEHIKEYVRYKCSDCSLIFNHQSNYSRHLLSCKSTDKQQISLKDVKKLLIETEHNIENKIEIKIKDSIQDSELNTNVKTAIYQASSIIKYLMQKYPNAPPLELTTNEVALMAIKNKYKKELEYIHDNYDDDDDDNINYQDNSDEDELDNSDNYKDDTNCDPDVKEDNIRYKEYLKNKDLMTKFLNNKNYILHSCIVKDFKDGNFIKYISEIILNIVKKDDPSKQSIWNTDSSRLNYAIKLSVDKWAEDKSAIKFTDLVIKPTLLQIKLLLEEYKKYILDTFNELPTVNKKTIGFKLLEKIPLIEELNTNIMSESITIKPIIRYLSSTLRFLESELKKLN
jgi:hypothetical protein